MENLRIELVRQKDLERVVALFAEQVYSWEPNEAQTHFADHAAGEGVTFLAFGGEALAGYVTIRWRSNNPQFRRENIPLIHHLAVFPEFQRRGVATRLMEEAERLIATRADKVGITVGLFDAYGPAQRLYARRGYVPDGRGVCQGQRPLQKGETVTMNHDLILWLTKDLDAGATAV